MTDKPSCRLRVGDIVTVKPNPRSQELISRTSPLRPAFEKTNWLTTDQEKHSFSLPMLPNPDEIDASANIPLIVELYSR